MNISPRDYQKNIANVAKDHNTLIVLPTGLGKTLIAILVIEHFLEKGKVLFLAPSKPLVRQHLKAIKDYFKDELLVGVVDGTIPRDKRRLIYRTKKIIIATPQVVRNDIIANIVPIKEFSLLVFDEAHRAVGNYAYVFIAKYFKNKNQGIRIIGLTATPGSSKEKIKEVLKNLFIERIEVRTTESPDVKKYLKNIVMKWVFVEKDANIELVLKNIDECIAKSLKKLKEQGIVIEKNFLSKKYLLEAKARISKMLIKDKKYFNALVEINKLIKLFYLKELLETQGIPQAFEYLKELIERIKTGKSTRYLRELILDEDFTRVRTLLARLVSLGHIHPKFDKVYELLVNEDFTRAIVFTQLRLTGKLLKEYLSSKGLRVLYFAGQKDISQKNQSLVIKDFERSKNTVLVATSIAEEGIDIPEVDLIIFYEPVPSVIRYIQRRGRTGRSKEGKVYILVYKGLEERIYWIMRHRERKFLKIINELKEELFKDHGENMTLLESLDGTKPKTSQGSAEILIDDRETKSPVIDKLLELGAKIKVERLPIGDYIIGNVVFERKTAMDFISSIVDNRLFEQLRKDKSYYDNVYLIIEGDIYNSGFRPESLTGALVTIMNDLGIRIVNTEGPEQTALFLYTFAKHLKKQKTTGPVVQKTSLSIEKIQERVLQQFPQIGPKTARELLLEFGSLKNVFNASLPELRKVVGDKIAKKLKMILEHKYTK